MRCKLLLLGCPIKYEQKLYTFSALHHSIYLNNIAAGMYDHSVNRLQGEQRIKKQNRLYVLFLIYFLLLVTPAIAV